jgi:CheY-like chemotaxis protein
VNDSTLAGVEGGGRSGERPTVLVVDDDAGVLKSLVELLRRDYRVIGTTDSGEALAALEGEHEMR